MKYPVNFYSDVHAYEESKSRAENAAWTYIAENKVHFTLTTVNPSLIIGLFINQSINQSRHAGPLLSSVPTPSAEFTGMITANLPAFPAFYVNAIDVRDVALAHLRCQERPGAQGQRFD